MNIAKFFFNRNYKLLMLLFSINPIVNIILDNRKKEILQSYFSQVGTVLTIVIFLIFIYYSHNLERVKRINTEKTSFVVFAIFSLICSILKYTFIETLIISLEVTLIFFVLMKVFINKIENKINRIKIVESKDIYKGEEKLYESRVPSKNRILELLKGDRKSLILVDGEWGIGKTFFMDKVLEEDKSILAVKVDVLLFNEKSQMINFVMKEIHKILLEKGVRSTSIRKYLSIINEGIDNKVLNGLYRLFSDDKAADIENNIKEDIQSLDKEKLVIIVDNLERTLDGDITIAILGFLHYIYEKLSINIVVLADSNKLINEIGNENYLKKFFIESIFLTKVNYYEIIKEMEKDYRKLFLSNKDIQDNIEDEYKSNSQKLYADIESQSPHESKEKEVEKKRKSLNYYYADYEKLSRTFGNPRAYESVINIYEDLNLRVEKLYKLKVEEIKKYEHIILRIAFYKEIYGDMKVEKTKFYEEFTLTLNMLYPEADNDGIKTSLVSMINYSNDDILEAIEIIESTEINYDEENISDLLENFQIYYESLFFILDSKKEKLIKFFEIRKNDFFEFLNNPENMEYLTSGKLKFEGLVYIDRMNYISNEDSIIIRLYKENRLFKFRKNGIENSINGIILKLTRDYLIEIYDKTENDYPTEFDYNFRHLIPNLRNSTNDYGVSEVQKKIQEIREKLNNSKLFNTEKKCVEYFLVCFEEYFGQIKSNLIYQKSKLEEFCEVLEKISILKNEMSLLGTSVEEQFKFKELKSELKENDQERVRIRKNLQFNYYFPIETVEELQEKIDMTKQMYSLSGDLKDVIDYEFSMSSISGDSRTLKLTEIYNTFVNDKKIERDREFEKLFEMEVKFDFKK